MAALTTLTLAVLLLVGLLSQAALAAASSALAAVDRHTLRQRARSGEHRAAQAETLLKRPAQTLALLHGLRILVLFGVAATTLALAAHASSAGSSIFVLAVALLASVVAGELVPRVLGALYAAPVMLALAPTLAFTSRLAVPLAWLLDATTRGLLRLAGVGRRGMVAMQERVETRAAALDVLAAAPTGVRVPISIAELTDATVEDVMVPRSEITGIDIAADEATIIEHLRTARHTHLPVFEHGIENLLGMLHVRRIPSVLARENVREALRASLEEPYYIPEGTPLHRQLLAFQQHGRRAGMVVDEYGDIIGLVTLEDIVSEMAVDLAETGGTLRDLRPQQDGSVVVHGVTSVRALNRRLGWHLPAEGPRTVNGLILEHLESIPPAGTSLKIADYTFEILQTSENAVRSVRITPPH
ncbi:MAG TPA: CNNM domain-containing protein [Gammaproteobacteria bacterium]|nr:CNNM domain-containing protein [Gammaproteobacteria bacterium]